MLSAKIAVLIGSDLEWYRSFATQFYEFGEGLENVGPERFYFTEGNDVNKPGSLTFDIDPGEDFYVLAHMSAGAQNGYADAWNTLTLNFQDDSGLTAAAGTTVNTVPAPGTLLLLGTGLLGGCPRIGNLLRKSWIWPDFPIIFV